MNVHVDVQFPETVFSALRRTPEGLVAEMRIAATVKWYELRLLSQAKAAEVAGLTRHDFLSALARFGVSPFQTRVAELMAEVSRE